jgi:TIR domain
MSSVFISYRRQTASGEARALYNDLVARLGSDAVFMDVDNISLGRDFRGELQKTLAACDLMLVIIDKDWATAKDEKGQNRLENAGDFVRMEIEAALKRDIAVTPVLVDGAQMPTAKELPAEISDLAYRNGFELSHGRWESDVREMIRRLNLDVRERDGREAGRSALLEKPPANMRAAPGTRWLIAIPIAIVAALGGYAAFKRPGQSTRCDLTGTWLNNDKGYSLKQNGTSVDFQYRTNTVDHYGSGTLEKDGRRVVLNLARVVKSDGCRVKGTSTIDIISCNELRSDTQWDAGCDLPQGASESNATSHRAP